MNTAFVKFVVSPPPIALSSKFRMRDDMSVCRHAMQCVFSEHGHTCVCVFQCECTYSYMYTRPWVNVRVRIHACRRARGRLFLRLLTDAYVRKRERERGGWGGEIPCARSYPSFRGCLRTLMFDFCICTRAGTCV